MDRPSDTELLDQIMYATFEGMIGRVSRDTRLIAIGWTHTHFHIKAVYDRPVTDEDREDIDEIVNEVLASAPSIIDITQEVICSSTPIGKIDKLRRVVFSRKEGIDEKSLGC
jgi:hypothetical protein